MHPRFSLISKFLNGKFTKKLPNLDFFKIITKKNLLLDFYFYQNYSNYTKSKQIWQIWSNACIQHDCTISTHNFGFTASGKLPFLHTKSAVSLFL